MSHPTSRSMCESWQWRALPLVLGPVVGVILGTIAGFLWVKRGFDGLVRGLSLAGFGWLFFWIAFRWWFVRWGRKNWLETTGQQAVIKVD